ncbi:MAG: DUF1538 domain-containing protein [Oscillospiraceae bacterium]|nr:DUF1538 domain-containing protein [Oscillospiraceae bacterium]
MPDHRFLMTKLKEAIASVGPIVLTVMVICGFFVPLDSGLMLSFLTGAALLAAGMTLFTLGSELSVSKMGEYVGSYIPRSRKIMIIVGMAFVLGFIITISEPDLLVLARLVPSVPDLVLILSVAAGVGLFLVAALLRMLFSVPLPPMLCVLYLIVFILTLFVPQSFLSVAFDSGGVTTGPMTVPFIMSLGVGVSAIRSDRHAEDDSFGLVALCSVGPILSVLVLGMIYSPTESTSSLTEMPEVTDSIELFRLFLGSLPMHMKEIAVSLLPIIVFMGIFQTAVLRIPLKKINSIVIGLVYTYAGLVLFLTGANAGFMPAGNYLGQKLADDKFGIIIIPVGMLLGYFIVRAEPAVYVLNKQVEKITNGNISEKAMGTALSAGVAVSVGIAMIRVLTGISILWFVLPGYAAALILSFAVPKLYTAIAFDSGGVASGPMTAAFLVPLAQGACTTTGGNIMTDAFGVVAMVAMTPLITIQIMGLISVIKDKKAARRAAALALEFENMDEEAIIGV